MAKMNRRARAIGFAVYLDQIEKVLPNDKEYDVDVLVEYGNKKDISLIAKAVKEINDKGQSVVAYKCAPKNLKYKEIVRLK